MADYKEIKYEKQRKGVLLTLNCPERMNAISPTMLKEMHQALDEIEDDPEIRAVVITGAGRAFSSGMHQRAEDGFGFFLQPEGADGILLKAVQIVQAVQSLRSVQAVHRRNGGAVAASTRMILWNTAWRYSAGCKNKSWLTSFQ